MFGLNRSAIYCHNTNKRTCEEQSFPSDFPFMIFFQADIHRWEKLTNLFFTLSRKLNHLFDNDAGQCRDFLFIYFFIFLNFFWGGYFSDFRGLFWAFRGQIRPEPPCIFFTEPVLYHVSELLDVKIKPLLNHMYMASPRKNINLVPQGTMFIC